MKLFLDPNLIDYALKRGAIFDKVLDKISQLGEMYTDVKALMEVIYRYHLLNETKLGYQRANEIKIKLNVLNVNVEDIDKQEKLMERYPNVKPRELLHVAVMLNNNINKIICSPDSNYSNIEEIQVEPVLSKIINL